MPVVEENVPVSGTRSLKVRSDRNGGIRVAAATSSTFAVKACKASALGNVNDIRVNVSGNEVSADRAGDDSRSVVYFLVFAPRNATLDLDASNGPISIGGVDASITAHALNGPDLAFLRLGRDDQDVDGALPGVDRALSHAAKLVFRPAIGEKLSAQRNPATRDLVRHAFADVGGNGNRARSWAKFARRWPTGAQHALLDAYPRIETPVLLLWAEEDPAHPALAASEGLAG